MVTVVKERTLVDDIQKKVAGIEGQIITGIIAVAVEVMADILEHEQLKTPTALFKSLDKGVVEVKLRKKVDRRKKWIAKKKNYKKVLETNNEWFKSDKGKEAMKRSKVGVARLIRADYALEVKKLRAETGLSQKEFSELVGIAKSSLQAIEYGNAYLSDERMSLILNHLGYDGEELSEKVLMFSNLAYPVSEVRNYLCENLGFDFEKSDNDGFDKELIECAISDWQHSLFRPRD